MIDEIEEKAQKVLNFTLITSCDAIPPVKAATTWSSAAPNRHISLMRSSDKVKPLQPKSLSRPTAVVFNRDMSSSIPLQGISID